MLTSVRLDPDGGLLKLRRLRFCFLSHSPSQACFLGTSTCFSLSSVSHLAFLQYLLSSLNTFPPPPWHQGAMTAVAPFWASPASWCGARTTKNGELGQTIGLQGSTARAIPSLSLASFAAAPTTTSRSAGLRWRGEKRGLGYRNRPARPQQFQGADAITPCRCVARRTCRGAAEALPRGRY